MRLRWMIILTAATLAGCGDSPQAAKPGVKNVINLQTADAELVLATVGGHPVTCGDIRNRQSFEDAIWKIQHPKVKEVEKGLAAYRERRMKGILPTLVNQAAIELWAAEKKVSLTAKERAAAEAKALRGIGFKFGVEKFADKSGCDVEYASRQLCTSALLDKARVEFDPASTNLTEQEIDDGLARMAAYYDRAIASNAVTWATCSNVIEKICKGLDFAKAAEKYGYENGDEGVKWDEFMPIEIEDKALKTWAYSAPIGTMKIFELDDGISIVKILNRKDGAVEPSVVAKEDAEVTLARIRFAMVEPEPEPRTREYVREALLKWKARVAQKLLMQQVLEKYPLAYPNENAVMRLK